MKPTREIIKVNQYSMKTKIYYGRDLIGRFSCDGRTYTKFQYQMLLAKNMLIKSIIVSSILVCAAWIYTAGIFTAKAGIAPETVYAKEVVEVPIKEVPPVMKRIAKCESSTGHYKNGKVVISVNKNGTSDIGKYQINTIHLPMVASLKLNVLDEKDNEAIAMYIYENVGTEPWYSSKQCWNK